MHVSDHHFARLRFTEASCKQCPSPVAPLLRVRRYNVVARTTMFDDVVRINSNSMANLRCFFICRNDVSFATLRRFSQSRNEIKTDRRDCKHFVGNHKIGGGGGRVGII